MNDFSYEKNLYICLRFSLAEDSRRKDLCVIQNNHIVFFQILGKIEKNSVAY